MSDCGGSPLWGFASAFPEEFFPPLLEDRFFPTEADEDGRVLRAPYALSKVESILLQNGLSREQVVIADPRRLHEVIGPETKVLGITTMDPLGVSFGSGIIYMLMRLLDYTPRGRPYISRSSLRVLDHPAVQEHMPKVIAGGSAVWQLLDLADCMSMGIDCVVEGEAEKVAPALFHKALRGEELPTVVRGSPPSASEIPPIVTPSIGGLVEITRGCGRGCRFCHPTLLSFRSIPLDTIEREVLLNIEGGARAVCLHSEEFFRYGVCGLTPDPERLHKLLQRVSGLTGDDVRLETDFTAAASIMAKPEVVPLVADYMTQDGWSYIEMGIETPSPRLITKIMPGKVLPFRPEEYADIVEQSIGLLNDQGWIVCATLITNMPGEEEEDVLEALEMVDRLKGSKALIHVLPFIPMGGLRSSPQTIFDEILANPLRAELVIKGFLLTNAALQSRPGREAGCRGIVSSASRLLRQLALWVSAGYATRKLRERLRDIGQGSAAFLSVSKPVVR